MSGFDRLHPAVQHHIVNSLGWPRLRPLQDATVEPILEGEHILALAPTAGGKTESAVFPLLTRILDEEWRGLSVLYVCPLRALLNNLHPRLERYCGYVGLRAGLWHGDVPGSQRKRLLAEPPEILLTTPESLEAMLISTSVDHRALLGGVRAIVVDEVHAFGGDDRGWHLLAVLERISAFLGHDVQRIGLSATVGDPDSLLDWLAGSAPGVRRVVNPPADAAATPALTVDAVGSIDNAAVVLGALYQGQKRLVFADSRARVEMLASKLRERGVSTYVSHSSLAQDERRRAEEAFAEAQDCVIVATSTLELGIDVGDLDQVIQIDAPGTVASFLQRLGRTGRRAGSERRMLFLGTSDPMSTVVTVALLWLWEQRYVEPIAPPPMPWHLAAQQFLAVALQEGAVGRTTWRDSIGRLPVFGEQIEGGLMDRVVGHLLDSGMLHDDGSGRLTMGTEAEANYGHRHFMELTSLFTAPPLFLVRFGNRDVGHVDPVSLLRPDRAFARLLLAGRVWQVTGIDWNARQAWVEPAEGEGNVRWLGASAGLSFRLASAVREVLAGDTPAGVQLTARAAEVLEGLREAHPWVRSGRTAIVHESADSVRWWTFAGTRVNATLLAALGGLAEGAQVDDLSVRLHPVRGRRSAVAEVLAELDPEVPIASPWHRQFAESLKFADCLPADVALVVARARLHDPVGVAAVCAAPIDEVWGEH